jgi:hypothetical protein
MYTFEEYEAMLKFTCGVEAMSSAALKSDQAFNSHLIKLHEVMGSDA